MNHNSLFKIALLALAGFFFSNSVWGFDPFSAYNVRIKDIAQVEGARANQLRGLGVVTGLDDTGDSSDDSIVHLMMKNIVGAEGLIPNQNLDNLSDSNAAVMVYAEIPAFAKPGTKLDVHVAAIGGAESLQGGFLFQTPLKGADGKVYAVAQGPITTGTFEFRGRNTRIQAGISTTVGTISQGAIVEEEIPVTMMRGEYIHLNLKSPDFTTALRVAETINAAKVYKEGFPAKPAAAIDATTIKIEVPKNHQSEAELVNLITQIENLYVEPDQVARIVVNERTGTIVIGQHVRIATVAVSHGGLSVGIAEAEIASQPGAFSEGTTEVLGRTGIEVSGGGTKTKVLHGGINVSELAEALNALGASPRDIIAILQAIKTAGALQAELIIM